MTSTLTTKVSIIGGGGYGAAELLRHLLARDDVEIVHISDKDQVGKSIAEVHRTLNSAKARQLKLEELTPVECIQGADIVFLAMPHITTARVAMDLLEHDVKIIDLSGDFRLHSLQDYQQDYAPEHPCPERLGTFVYGMPELNSQAISTARHVASPGCFATAITLGLLPLAKAGLLAESNIRCVAMTGSSGSGVRPAAGTHHPIRSNNLKAYKPLHHQHRAEIVQTLKQGGAESLSLDFIPVSAPLTRGILAISQLDIPAPSSRALGLEELQKIYQQHFAPFEHIELLAAPDSPEVVLVKNSIKVQISISTRYDLATGQQTLACICAIDNLVKGGAGQAIQSFNLMTGKPLNHGFSLLTAYP